MILMLKNVNEHEIIKQVNHVNLNRSLFLNIKTKLLENIILSYFFRKVRKVYLKVFNLKIQIFKDYFT